MENKHIDMIMINNRYMKGQELGPINHVKLRGVCEDLFIFDTRNGRFDIMNSDITKGIIQLYNWPSHSQWFPDTKPEQFFTPDELERRLLILLEDKELDKTIKNSLDEMTFPLFKYDIAVSPSKPVIFND